MSARTPQETAQVVTRLSQFTAHMVAQLNISPTSVTVEDLAGFYSQPGVTFQLTGTDVDGVNKVGDWFGLDPADPTHPNYIRTGPYEVFGIRFILRVYTGRPADMPMQVAEVPA